MKKLFLLALLFSVFTAAAQPDVKLKKKDRRRDVALVTTEGTIILRLSDATPLHRDNFLKLVKSRYYDSMLFHRVIPTFMIQTGDPNSKSATAVQTLGSGGPGYTVPAEFRPFLFHKRGALAAARMGDDVNPQRASSGSHFYIVQGKTFTASQLDSIETKRLKGIKLPPAHREVYMKEGGTPQLDQHYTIFGEVLRGLEVVDRIALTTTNRQNGDRPVKDIRIIEAKLVKRKKR